jgi:hypothetical protein
MSAERIAFITKVFQRLHLSTNEVRQWILRSAPIRRECGIHRKPEVTVQPSAVSVDHVFDVGMQPEGAEGVGWDDGAFDPDLSLIQCPGEEPLTYSLDFD